MKRWIENFVYREINAERNLKGGRGEESLGLLLLMECTTSGEFEF